MKSGADQMVIDPDPDKIYTTRKKRIVNVMMSSTPSSSPSVKYPKFSGKNAFIHPCRNESAYYEFREKSREHPTSFYSNKFKKGENFFDRPIFKDIEATSDQRHFCFRAKCYHSFT